MRQLMHMGMLAATYCSLLGFSGCSSSSTTYHSDTGGAPSITLEPEDLSTDHDGQSVRIAARNDHHGPATLFADAITLRRHPTGDIVPVTLDAEPGGSSQTKALFAVHPDAPLEAGWYSLVVEQDGTSQFPGTHARGDGAFESRFRVGSEPLLLGIQACGNHDVKLAVELEFSEEVELAGSDSSLEVFVGGSAVACDVGTPFPSNIAHLQCAPSASEAAAISVSVGTGIVSSSSGQALATSTGAMPRTFDLPTEPEHDGCRHWRETATPLD